MICRGTDILKDFKGSLGIRDNESRLYINSYDQRSDSTYAFVVPLLPVVRFRPCFLYCMHYIYCSLLGTLLFVCSSLVPSRKRILSVSSVEITVSVGLNILIRD